MEPKHDNKVQLESLFLNVFNDAATRAHFLAVDALERAGALGTSPKEGPSMADDDLSLFLVVFWLDGEPHSWPVLGLDMEDAQGRIERAFDKKIEFLGVGCVGRAQ